jgi:hypothetical protein
MESHGPHRSVRENKSRKKECDDSGRHRAVAAAVIDGWRLSVLYCSNKTKRKGPKRLTLTTTDLVRSRTLFLFWCDFAVKPRLANLPICFDGEGERVGESWQFGSCDSSAVRCPLLLDTRPRPHLVSETAPNAVRAGGGREGWRTETTSGTI